MSAAREIENISRNLKLVLLVAIHAGLEGRALKIFKDFTKQAAESVQHIELICLNATKISNVSTVYVDIAELLYHVAKKGGEESDIDFSLRCLANLKNAASTEVVTEWPFKASFAAKVKHLAEYKYLYGVHFYQAKDYVKAKRYFFSAVLLDPAYKAYIGHYYEYLITSERAYIINPYTASKDRSEVNLLMMLNNPNVPLKQKIQHLAKTAIYLHKPYLFYLLAHFSFEDRQNYTPTRLLKLMEMLRCKVMSEKYDKNG